MLKVVQIIPDERDVWGFDADSPSFGSAPTALLEGFAQFPDQVDVHVVSCIRRPLPAPAILSGNIHYHAVPVSGGYRRTLFTEAVRRTRAVIRKIDPDIVHGQGNEDYPGLCAVFSGFPNVVTVHGNMRAVAARRRFRPLPHMLLACAIEWIALRRADTVFCNSAYTDRQVKPLNEKRHRVFNAVRSDFFSLAAKEISTSKGNGVGANCRTLLCSGTVVEYKNQIGLIRALDAWEGPRPFRLLFAGGSRPELPYVRRFLDLVRERDWCDYRGRLEAAELLHLLADIDGVVHPTLEDSFGLAVAEAQAAGLPVAASSIGGIPDLIEDGKTGFLFDPANPADVRRKVGFLLDPATALPVSAEARRFADEQYRPACIAESHLDFYRDHLADSTPGY
jgi:glycosyltransferase involved in cell wall biosynthesis